MLASVRALLSSIIDYAGMFPPANLPLDQAIRNYARYRTEPEGWMLGRFVCPAARLGDLSPHVDALFAGGPPLALTVLGQGGGELAPFLDRLRGDLAQMTAFYRTHGERVRIDAYETRLPDVATTPSPSPLPGGGGEGWVRGLGTAAEQIEAGSPTPVSVFLELNWAADWRTRVSAAVMALAEVHHSVESRGWRRCRATGFKLRCGGAAPTAVPSVEQVAGVLTQCRDEHVPLKATAGLHHPLRHYDPALGTQLHGFLNVFVAGVLAFTHTGLPLERVQQIVGDPEGSHFTFSEKGLHWTNYAAALEEILAARQHAVISFGSCSFDEPRDDLRALGFLP